MRVSELINRLKEILDREGDIDVELPDGTLMKRIEVVTVSKEQEFEGGEYGGYSELLTEVHRLASAALPEAERMERRLRFLMLGYTVFCAGVWGEKGAKYFVAGPTIQGPLENSPFEAIDAAMKEKPDGQT